MGNRRRYFQRLRSEVLQTPPDKLKRLDLLRLRAFLLDALAVCDWLCDEHDEDEVDQAELLQLHLENLP